MPFLIHLAAVSAMVIRHVIYYSVINIPSFHPSLFLSLILEAVYHLSKIISVKAISHAINEMDKNTANKWFPVSMHFLSKNTKCGQEIT